MTTRSHRLLGCYTLALALSASSVWGEQSQHFTEASQLADRSVNHFTATDTANYQTLAADVAAAVGLDEQRKLLLQEASRPLITSSVELSRQIYLDHYLARLKEGRPPHNWKTLGKSVQSDASKQRRRDLHKQWQTILESQLTADQREVWEKERLRRKQRAETAHKNEVEQRVQLEVDLVHDHFNAECEWLAKVLKWDDEAKKKLTPAAKAAVDAFAPLFVEGARAAATDWDVEFVRLNSSSLGALETAGKMVLHVPTHEDAARAARAAFEKMIDGLLSQAEQEVVSKATGERDKRITKLATEATAERLKEITASKDLSDAWPLDQINTVLALSQERKQEVENALAERRKPLFENWRKEADARHSMELRQRLDDSKDKEAELADIEKRSFRPAISMKNSQLIEALKKLSIDLMNHHFTADERQLISGWKAAKKERTLQAYCAAAVVGLDQKLALLPAQRVKLTELLRPVCERLAAHPNRIKSIFRYGSISDMMAVVHGVDREQLHAQLDEAQIKRLTAALPELERTWSSLEALISHTKTPP
jgi:hypothetical protein